MHVVAKHYYFQGAHDPRWLLVDVAVEVTSGEALTIARDDISIVPPDGVELPLTSQREYRRARAELLPMRLALHMHLDTVRDHFPAGTCGDHNFRFFVDSGIRQTLVDASPVIGDCLRGDLFFASPTGTWNNGTYTLVIGGTRTCACRSRFADGQPVAAEFHYDGKRCRVWVGDNSMRSPLIAAVVLLTIFLLAAPSLTAERPAPGAAVDEPHEVNRPGRNIVEYSSDRLQVVAVHYYFPEGHDPRWLLLDVAIDVRSGDPIKVARRDFSVEGPDGLRVPLSTLPAFRRAHRQLRPMMLQLHTRERPIAGFFPVPCAEHNFRFFVPTGEIRQTEVHASWQGSCVRGDLFFGAPDGAWDQGTYTLVIDGDTNVRLPIEID